jgi:hypothetical protein
MNTISLTKEEPLTETDDEFHDAPDWESEMRELQLRAADSALEATERAEAAEDEKCKMSIWRSENSCLA